MEALLIDALNNLVERAPELAVLAIVAWDLRTQLRACIDHNQAILDQLLSDRLKRQ